MRNLPLLLALLLLTVLGTAATAQASLLPVVDQVSPFIADDEEEETEAEEAEDEAEEAQIDRELCEEDPEFCEEESEPKGKGQDKGDECLLKSAKASLTANPGKRRLRLTVHYKTLKPTTVSVEASLESPKGTIHLDTDHARFRRSGVYRDNYELPEKQMKKAAVARGFSVELHVVNAPAACDIELTGPSRLSKR
ncbi:MAG: hypothetical protein M3Y75_00355 [Actinomycetota bacterium]|nr:hypothetical protein [Actinomycetota bacterium]